MASKSYQRGVLLSVAIILSGSILVASSPTPPTLVGTFQRSLITENVEPLDCTTDFSGDYYGFGVRLGVYFAWLSSYFANTLLPSEISGSLDTNSIFLLGLLISLFNSTLHHEILQIDGLIIMQLSSGFLFSSLSLWGYRTSQYQKEGTAAIQRYGKIGTHCRLALAVAISMYGTWFWWEGLEDGLRVADNEKCQKISTWFFAEWPVSGGIHVFYIIVSFASSLYYGIMAITAVLAYMAKFFRVGWKGRMEYETGYSKRELKFLFNIFRVFNLFWIVFCAATIEMTLNKNHMLQTLAKNGEIAYPAQLIPLIIGTLSFVRVLWLIYSEWQEKNDRWSGSSNGEVKKTHHPSLHTGFNFTLDTFKQFFSFSAQPESSTPTFAAEESSMPDILRPWHHRYAVAILPWLSTFDSWKLESIARVAHR
ncbi:hypothetical protein D0Z07_8935 [Hyphodiscus hymeniophilus]|uniref:Uncharacterized protein n=1 Tax=Hyphodiscus hymeniophilus TaxID=353542 RepID=A0A9P6SLB9_9HELO|nr:hypothetical protein D0Z07_8935 [Hyphodiscus hymeniophilus]